MKKIKCVVVGRNDKDEPDIYFVKVQCSDAACRAGSHHDAAAKAAESAGYNAYLVYDETSATGAALVTLCQWDFAAEVMIAAGEDDSIAEAVVDDQSLGECARRAVELYYSAASTGRTAKENLAELVREFGQPCVDRMFAEGGVGCAL